jgi:hypothetical protein
MNGECLLTWPPHKKPNPPCPVRPDWWHACTIPLRDHKGRACVCECGAKRRNARSAEGKKK